MMTYPSPGRSDYWGEDLGRCIGCDYPFTEYDLEEDNQHEVVTKYGDGFSHEECIVEGMMTI